MGAGMGRSGTSGGLLEALPTGTPFHVAMLGLDSAGKTTALYRLKFDQYLNTVPTIGFNCERIRGGIGKAKGVNFLVWDVGGQEKLRPLWKSYTRCTDGIIFVVDSCDTERLEEAKMELTRTARSPDNASVPILILANKQDLPAAVYNLGAKEVSELEKHLGVLELTGMPGSSCIRVQPACAITGEGLHEGLDTLYQLILKRRKLAKLNRKRAR
ncbi:ADP-ribosylation factor-like protein 4C isoform X1 [Formica exsecta]|uniref:ADP-ribosylation factor-like protein 4C isoform X1 n=1 Tax=Formica exsecta TaxID=72781 RepID=UPI0011447831|nr:ADP-ribosylation factor-like protein 4C isoform X1 [Formica exsecta]XP_029674668.1 ADP-ribosylation factor-like protein 4C isoform X1 [Formica exsecta]XP_029674676.1 ADP-ribosylation factor-like protein 4C isoform X1 [Formica exsecta]XP_029674686.1 ADP-ribosylation factor-like protein 4C isoform X1 [Formica exsecta]XP_029674694.1 ADP-ribosylation factor-like protein 4C isoform X1 [Formica exsecta]XP_029674704.1 ADP-ribosylation factor-like protein 4C isoform X1 [Formica exsecta]XP_05046171